MPTRAALLTAFTLLALTACSPNEPTPLHERLLAPADVESLGWIDSEFRPDHEITIDADPAARACDGDYSASLASPVPRTSASRVYIDGDSVIQMELLSGVDDDTFAAIEALFDGCSDAITAVEIGDLPGMIALAAYDLDLPAGAFAVDSLTVTPLITMRQVQMFAHNEDDTLLSITLVNPTGGDAQTTDVLNRAIGAARSS